MVLGFGLSEKLCILGRMKMKAFIEEKHGQLLDALTDVPDDQLDVTLLTECLEVSLSVYDNPNGNRFWDAFSALPEVPSSFSTLDQALVSVHSKTNPPHLPSLESALLGLKPWRKGPFDFFGIEIDAEWRSSLKWDRLSDVLPKLEGRKILDVGANSGYYMFRMAATQPAFVLGIDPFPLYFFQFNAIQKYARLKNLHFAAMPLQKLTMFSRFFNVIFNMGILYHHRSPIEMLRQMHDLLANKGTLILETLIIEGEEDVALFPKATYAKMRNVFFLPTVSCLKNWMGRAGFKSVEVIHQAYTSIEEQRKTRWINTESLNHFLDPTDVKRTIEGYPAPLRILVKAQK